MRLQMENISYWSCIVLLATILTVVLLYKDDVFLLHKNENTDILYDTKCTKSISEQIAELANKYKSFTSYLEAIDKLDLKSIQDSAKYRSIDFYLDNCSLQLEDNEGKTTTEEEKIKDVEPDETICNVAVQVETKY